MKALCDALLEARKNMKMPPLNGVGHTGKGGSRTYKYATLVDVLACVMPPLLEQGVMLHQGFADGELKTIARKGDEVLVMDSRQVNLSGTSQEQGSAETYAKRYALCTVFCLSGDEDDDGQAASERPAQAPPNDVLAVAYRRMGAAVEGWCARHGCDSPDEVQAKKDGLKKRPEWASQCKSLEYINAVTREFENG